MTFFSKFKKDANKSSGFMFIKVYNLWHEKIKLALKEEDITHPQFVVLTSLGYLQQNNKEVTQKKIADIADMDVMTMSKILKLLEKKGLVKRAEHSEDSRAKAISLTQRGIEKNMKTIPIVEKIDKEVFGFLEEEEAYFRELLGKIVLQDKKDSKQ